MTMTASQRMTAKQLYKKLKSIRIGGEACHYSFKKCEEFIPLINDINELKHKKNAVILTHTYVYPEIIYGVGDFVGDSYKLSQDALKTDAQIIIFAAVRFMGETAKILNPHKDVLVPSLDDGCTLADAITADQVKELRKQYPDYTFVCYINTTAEVKAECDVCVTSANAYKIVANLPGKKIYFLPDKFMGRNIKDDLKEKGIKKDILYYPGTCYVHEEYNPDLILKVHTEYPSAKIVSHPECAPEVIEHSDFVGSTSQMFKYIKETSDSEFLMLTECGLGSRLQVEFPKKNLVGSCALCKYMKANKLADILRVLKNPLPRDYITVDEKIRVRALKCIEKMFEYA